MRPPNARGGAYYDDVLCARGPSSPLFLINLARLVLVGIATILWDQTEAAYERVWLRLLQFVCFYESRYYMSESTVLAIALQPVRSSFVTLPVCHILSVALSRPIDDKYEILNLP